MGLKTLLVGILFSISAIAVTPRGGDTGGGNVVVCKDATTGATSVRLLDYYEAAILYADIEPDFQAPEMGPGKTEMELVEYVLKRMSRVDRERAEDLGVLAKEWFADTKFLNKIVLPGINDHGYIPLEVGCVVEQVAVQNLIPSAKAKKYTVREDLWKQMSLQDRAGLILHEIIYNEILNHPTIDSTSRGTRYVNALVSSPALSKISLAEYERHLKEADFKLGYRKHNFKCPPVGYIPEIRQDLFRPNELFFYLELVRAFEYSPGSRRTSAVMTTRFPFSHRDEYGTIVAHRVEKYSGEHPYTARITDGIRSFECSGKVVIP